MLLEPTSSSRLNPVLRREILGNEQFPIVDTSNFNLLSCIPTRSKTLRMKPLLWRRRFHYCQRRNNTTATFRFRNRELSHITLNLASALIWPNMWRLPPLLETGWLLAAFSVLEINLLLFDTYPVPCTPVVSQRKLQSTTANDSHQVQSERRSIPVGILYKK